MSRLFLLCLFLSIRVPRCRLDVDGVARGGTGVRREQLWQPGRCNDVVRPCTACSPVAALCRFYYISTYACGITLSGVHHHFALASPIPLWLVTGLKGVLLVACTYCLEHGGRLLWFYGDVNCLVLVLMGARYFCVEGWDALPMRHVLHTSRAGFDNFPNGTRRNQFGSILPECWCLGINPKGAQGGCGQTCPHLYWGYRIPNTWYTGWYLVSRDLRVSGLLVTSFYRLEVLRIRYHAQVQDCSCTRNSP